MLIAIENWSKRWLYVWLGRRVTDSRLSLGYLADKNFKLANASAGVLLFPFNNILVTFYD